MSEDIPKEMKLPLLYGGTPFGEMHIEGQSTGRILRGQPELVTIYDEVGRYRHTPTIAKVASMDLANIEGRYLDAMLNTGMGKSGIPGDIEYITFDDSNLRNVMTLHNEMVKKDYSAQPESVGFISGRRMKTVKSKRLAKRKAQKQARKLNRR